MLYCQYKGIKNCYWSPKCIFLVVSWIYNSRPSPEALRVPFNTNLSKTALHFFFFWYYLLTRASDWLRSFTDKPDYVGSLLMLLKVNFCYWKLKFEDLLRVREPWESWLTYSTWFAVNTRQRKIRNNGSIKIDLRSLMNRWKMGESHL